MSVVEQRHWPDVHVVIHQVPGQPYQVDVPTVFVDGIALTTMGVVSIGSGANEDAPLAVTVTIPISRVTVEDVVS